MEFSLRVAELSDAESVWEIRNLPEVYTYFFDPKPVELTTHKQWFSSVIDDPNCFLLIAEAKGFILGVLRYDIVEPHKTDAVEVSIYLNPLFLGKGLSTHLLKQGELWLNAHHPEITEIIAKVLPQNAASLKCFEKGGFKHQYSVYTKQLNLSNNYFRA